MSSFTFASFSLARSSAGPSASSLTPWPACRLIVHRLTVHRLTVHRLTVHRLTVLLPGLLAFLVVACTACAAQPSQPERRAESEAELVLQARVLLDGYLAEPSRWVEARESLEASPATERGPRWVSVSLLRPEGPPVVAEGTGADTAVALGRAMLRLVPLATTEDARAGRLKVDVLVDRQAGTFDAKGRARLVLASLHGLYLPEVDLVLLPEELVSWGLMKNQDLQSRALRWYLAVGARADAPEIEGNPGRNGDPYEALSYSSWVETAEGPRELLRGRLPEPPLTPERLLAASVAGGDYLVRHQFADGRFGYSYFPPRDRYKDSYNLLRHAGSSYSLLELYGVTRDPRYLDAGERGIAYLATLLREPKPGDAAAGADFLALESPGREAKLGGAALMTLAILEHHRHTESQRWLPTAQALARFMVYMQRDDGKFTSKYFWGPPDPVPFDSVYYPGEAILALSRLAKIDTTGPWLETASDGAGWLMGVRDVGKSLDQLPHDHWLLMGLDELHRATDGGRTFFLHSRRIAESILRKQRQDLSTVPHPDWLGSYYTPPRSTPTATRSEGLVAAYRTASRVEGEDPQPYLDALLRAASFQLRCQLEELDGQSAGINGAYLPNPSKARGGFTASLDNWEVRIDYVQHNLSALLGLRALLLEQAAAASAPD